MRAPRLTSAPSTFAAADYHTSLSLIHICPDGKRRFFLNNKPYFQAGVLDQGYWPESLYTAPTDEALLSDILRMKKLGFNMLRKHAKIEPERFYYHCDQLGILVWQDMVNGGSPYKSWFVTYLATLMNWRHLPFSDGEKHFSLLSRSQPEGRAEFLREMEETVTFLYNHPSIVTWVPVSYTHLCRRFAAASSSPETTGCSISSRKRWYPYKYPGIR